MSNLYDLIGRNKDYFTLLLLYNTSLRYNNHIRYSTVYCIVYMYLEGSVSQDFRPLFLSRFKPIWAPDKHAKEFSNSVLISPRYSIIKLAPQCAAHRGDDLCSVHPTAESLFAVCNTTAETISMAWCTPWRQLCDQFEVNRNLHLSLVTFKGTIRRNSLRGEQIYLERKHLKYKMLVLLRNLFCLRGVQHTAEIKNCT